MIKALHFICKMSAWRFQNWNSLHNLKATKSEQWGDNKGVESIIPNPGSVSEDVSLHRATGLGSVFIYPPSVKRLFWKSFWRIQMYIMLSKKMNALKRFLLYMWQVQILQQSKFGNETNSLEIISNNWKSFRVKLVGQENKQIMTVIKPLHALFCMIFCIDTILHRTD